MNKTNDKNLEAVKILLPCYDEFWMEYTIMKEFIHMKVKLMVKENVYDMHLNEGSHIIKYMIGKRRYFSMQYVIKFHEIGKANAIVTHLLNHVQLQIACYTAELLNNKITVKLNNIKENKKML